MSIRLDIREIGGRGDGIAELDGRRYFVPFTLPGETVEAEPGASQDAKVGDVVTKFDDAKIANANELLALINKKKPGDEVVFEVRRGQETIKAKVTIGKQ